MDEENTPPFFTLDPMESKRLQPVMSAIDCGDWQVLIETDDDLRILLLKQGVEEPMNRSSIKWDDANLFFLSCLKQDRNSKPMTLEAGISKEKFGRFPYGDSSAISYLLEWIRPSTRDDAAFLNLQLHLEKLNSILKPTSMANGIGGLRMNGWLDAEETTQLRTDLTSTCWMPAGGEPLDGGCHYAAKHLVAMLRSAEKRVCGVLLRIHK